MAVFVNQDTQATEHLAKVSFHDFSWPISMVRILLVKLNAYATHNPDLNAHLYLGDKFVHLDLNLVICACFGKMF